MNSPLSICVPISPFYQPYTCNAAPRTSQISLWMVSVHILFQNPQNKHNSIPSKVIIVLYCYSATPSHSLTLRTISLSFWLFINCSKCLLRLRVCCRFVSSLLGFRIFHSPDGVCRLHSLVTP